MSPAERRISSERLLSEELKAALEVSKYSAGEYIRGKIPEVLYPNGTLARALRTLDIGERFGIRVDDLLLREAEKAVKDGSLSISCPPEDIEGREMATAISLYFGEEGVAGVEAGGERGIDNPFMKVAEKKSQFKRLKQNYPRLGTLVERIQEVGGPSEFILKNYGEAYLKRGSIHLYDVNLAKSPASLVEQEEFLQTWEGYAERSVHFPFKEVKRIGAETEILSSSKVQELIDKELLAGALKDRHASHLSKALGTYEVSIDRALSVGAREKVDALLGVYRLCWDEVTERSRANLTTQLVKLGVHPRNPVLGELDETKEHEVKLVITNEPEAILGASTDKPWLSCVELGGGGYERGLYEDVENGSAIAYLLKDNKFVGRTMVRPTETVPKTVVEGLVSRLKTGESRDAAGIERYYGDERYSKALIEALKQVLDEKKIQHKKESVTLRPFSHAWTDSGRKDRQSHIIYRSTG